MKFGAIFLIFIGVLSTIQADNGFNIPILGPVLGTITDVSKGVVNTALDTVNYAGQETFNLVENRLQTLAEDFKKMMVNEIEILGLPRLEPLNIEHVDIDLKHEIGNFNGTLDDVVIEGLSTFNLEHVKFELKGGYHIVLNLTFDHLIINGLYDITAEVGDMFHIYGDGPFTATVYNVKIGADVLLNFKNKIFYVDDIHVTFKLGSMECDFKNLMGGGENGELFNKVIARLAPEAVDNLWPEIEPILSEQLKETGTKKLANIPFDLIFDILKPW